MSSLLGQGFIPKSGKIKRSKLMEQFLLNTKMAIAMFDCEARPELVVW